MDDQLLQVREAQQGQHGPPQAQTTSSSTSSTSSSETESKTSTSSATETAASVISTTSSLSSTHSSTPSASPIAVSSSASTPSTSSNAASGATSVPELTQANTSNGPPIGAIAAGVIVPVILIILLVFGLLWRRRRRSGNASMLPVMKERSRPRANGAAPPILMSNTNTAYYTGIDTSTDEPTGEYYNGLGDSFEPPPPYKTKNLDGTRNVTIPVGVGSSTVPAVREPTGYRRDSPSPDSWATPPRDNSLLEPSEGYARSISSQAVTDTRSISSQAVTEQSITSTQYSDSASIHSAQAARMSVGGANVLVNRSQLSLDPFGDPDSSVSSLAGDRSNNPSRGISPVSLDSRNRQ